MGLFDFLKNIGKNVDDGKEADQIKEHLSIGLGDSINGLNVAYDDGTVTLSGEADSFATKQKAVLMAGNVKNVEKVNDMMTVKVDDPEPEPKFYTVQKGDSLSKIAKEVYGDYMKWEALFAANKEVIENPDLIYPGQQIRVPEL
ncbi:MAG: peptidoglycan-binding protein LysM [Rhodothermaceae bacterium]|nr:peptidoglycan-binding protein LysM [Rhodothermaceae bacterium]